MYRNPKKGDLVRHIEGDWYAEVAEVRVNTIVVQGNSSANNGEYSSLVFELVPEGAHPTSPVVETPTTEE